MNKTVYRIEYEDSKGNWVNLNEIMCLFFPEEPTYFLSKREVEETKEDLLKNKAGANLRIIEFLPEIIKT